MNWFNHLQGIYAVLDAKGYKEIKEELLEAQKIGGTGGEIFMIISDKLQEIKVKHPLVYNEIENDAECILNYGKSIGYL
jgi:hypothetical protein